MRILTLLFLAGILAACDEARPRPDGKIHVSSALTVDVLSVSEVVLDGSQVVDHVRVLGVRMPNGREGEILIATDEPIAAGDKVKLYEFNLKNPFRSTELAPTEPITLAIRANN